MESSRVRIWNMKSVSTDIENDATSQRLLATLRDHFGSVNCVRWAKHGRFVASGSDDQAILIHERKPGSGTTEFGSGEPPDIENWKASWMVTLWSFYHHYSWFPEAKAFCPSARERGMVCNV
ncbi:hypothetical protein V8G54_027525 [Vigna mungo]|uniref:Uncharacterized protein n=1 Tax=Vigna mungo TaxID=3915 RepID=A0AAQ3RRH1_VIGMU